MFLSNLKAQSYPELGTINRQSNSTNCTGLCQSGALQTQQVIKSVSRNLERMDQNLEEDSITNLDFKNSLTSLQSLQSHPLITRCKDYLILYPLIFFCIWALLYILWDEMALPGGALFALCVLEIVALLLGQFSEKLGMPSFLGMLVAGFLLRNSSHSINVGKDLTLTISSPLRGISVVILLTQGALSVNQENIRKFVKVIPGLVVGSCLTEGIIGSLAAYLIIEFSIEWALLMGFIISAMSGCGVMPYLLQMESRLDSKPGLLPIPSSRDFIVIAKTACGLDAILGICLAKFCLGYIFCEGDTTCGFIKGPFEVLIGGAFGVLWGGLSGLLLNNNHGNDLRSIAVFSGGVMSLVGSIKIGYPRGGPLGVFLGALIASSIWRHREVDGRNNDRLNVTFKKLWFVFQPMLFGILGARTDFGTVDWVIVAKGMLCLGISLFARMTASFLLTRWSNLPICERMFIALAWIPKGTMQAALGPVALDTALELQLGDSFTTPAYHVMNISAAVIVTTSILCPIILNILGPRLVSRKHKIAAEIPYNCTEVLLPTEIMSKDEILD